jgi:acetylornithine deacetylase
MMKPLDVVDLTLDLARIDSTSGQEGQVIAFVERLLASRGWTATRIPVTPGRDDIFATTDPAPLVTLSTHLDTVPPYIPPRERLIVSPDAACATPRVSLPP